MVSTETLAKTARLRAICKHQSHPLNAMGCCHPDAGPVDLVAVAFLLVLTSTFMIASMSTRGGKRSQSRRWTCFRSLTCFLFVCRLGSGSDHHDLDAAYYDDSIVSG